LIRDGRFEGPKTEFSLWPPSSVKTSVKATVELPRPLDGSSVARPTRTDALRTPIALVDKVSDAFSGVLPDVLKVGTNR
jgi:hypothetical protein